jgi:Ca2+-binding RTX toxin-like protein
MSNLVTPYVAADAQYLYPLYEADLLREIRDIKLQAPLNGTYGSSGMYRKIGDAIITSERHFFQTLNTQLSNEYQPVIDFNLVEVFEVYSTYALKFRELTSQAGPLAAVYASEVDGVRDEQTAYLNLFTTPWTINASPSDNTTNIAVGSNITLTFSEAIQKGTGNIEIRQGSATGTLIESFSPTSTRVTVSGSTLTIDPTKNLSNGTQYFVVLPSGSVTDLAGNNFAGTSTYDFTTVAAPDTTPPTVTTFTPSDNTTNIAVGSNITLTFSEAIQKGTGNIEIRQGSATGPVVETFDAASSDRLTILGSQLTIDPTSNLSGGTQYFVVLPSGAIKDIAGNNWAGTGTNPYDFTTVAAPNSAPTLTSFGTSVKSTNEDTAVSISFAELLSKGNEADVDGSVTSFVVKAVSSGTLKINSTSWNATTNNTIDATKSAVWTPAKDANGTLNAFTVVAKDDDGSESTTAVQAKVVVTAGKKLVGGNGHDKLTGGTSNDSLNGGKGNDKLNGGAGSDIMLGGAGDDTYYVDTSSDKVYETTSTSSTTNAGGTDLVYSSVSFNLNAYTGVKFVENLTLTGSSNINATGNSLANQITGNSKNNKLDGGSGNDVLNGGAGSDFLTGGAGSDKLYGGSDTVRDVFDFNAITESKVGTARDKVYDFVTKIDKIDLSGIDANTATAKTGDQGFTFNNTTAKANSVWYKVVDVDGSSATKDIVIYGDVDGNTTADFEIGLVGVTSIAATDFVL